MLRIISCFLFVITAYLPMQAQQAFSIEEAVQYGIKNHASIKYDAIKVKDADEQIRSLKASGLPQINGAVDYNYFLEVPQLVLPPEFDPTGMGGSVSFQLRNSLAMGINMGMLAFDGSYVVAIKAAKVYRDFIAIQNEQTPINLRIAITQAYYSVLIAQRNKEQLSKNLLVLQDLRKETAAILESGLIEKLDVDRIDLSINTLEATMKNLDRGLEVVKSLLKFQMQYPEDQDITLTDSFENLYDLAVVADQQSVTQHNIKNRIEYNIIDKGIELAGLDITRYRKGYLPSLTLIGSFQRTFQSDNFFKEGGFWLPTSVVGFSLNVPIFDGFAKDANIERAKLTLEKSRLDKSEFERAVGLEVKNARESYLNAIETVKDRERAIALAEEIFRVSQIKYKEGIGSSFEVKQAESDLYGAQANYISAQYEVINSRFTLQKALGVYTK
jgi:outer membrane protein